VTGAVKISRADPLTPPEKHTGKGEEKALTEAVRNTTMPQLGNNNWCLAREVFSLTEGLLMGDSSLYPLPVASIWITPKIIRQTLDYMYGRQCRCYMTQTPPQFLSHSCYTENREYNNSQNESILLGSSQSTVSHDHM
jgi:hypothetical protein